MVHAVLSFSVSKFEVGAHSGDNVHVRLLRALGLNMDFRHASGYGRAWTMLRNHIVRYRLSAQGKSGGGWTYGSGRCGYVRRPSTERGQGERVGVVCARRILFSEALSCEQSSEERVRVDGKSRVV